MFYTRRSSLLSLLFSSVFLFFMRRQVLLWISPDDGNENGKRDADLVRFCLEKNDDESLLLSIFVSLIFRVLSSSFFFLGNSKI